MGIPTHTIGIIRGLSSSDNRTQSPNRLEIIEFSELLDFYYVLLGFRFHENKNLGTIAASYNLATFNARLEIKLNFLLQVAVSRFPSYSTILEMADTLH